IRHVQVCRDDRSVPVCWVHGEHLHAYPSSAAHGISIRNCVLERKVEFRLPTFLLLSGQPKCLLGGRAIRRRHEKRQQRDNDGCDWRPGPPTRVVRRRGDDKHVHSSSMPRSNGSLPASSIPVSTRSRIGPSWLRACLVRPHMTAKPWCSSPRPTIAI